MSFLNNSFDSLVSVKTKFFCIMVCTLVVIGYFSNQVIKTNTNSTMLNSVLQHTQSYKMTKRAEFTVNKYLYSEIINKEYKDSSLYRNRIIRPQHLTKELKYILTVDRNNSPLLQSFHVVKIKNEIGNKSSRDYIFNKSEKIVEKATKVSEMQLSFSGAKEWETLAISDNSIEVAENLKRLLRDNGY